MKKELVFLLIAISLVLVFNLFISGCNIKEENLYYNRFGEKDSEQYRSFTYYNCQHLVNQTLDFQGKVIYEECGKNCLGGCPYNGPDYCYYGIQDKDNCTVYVPSRIDSLGNEAFKNKEKIFHEFEINQEVTLNGTIEIYHSLNCYSIFACDYFMLEKGLDF